MVAPLPAGPTPPLSIPAQTHSSPPRPLPPRSASGSPGEGGDASDAALHLGATLTAERHQELVYDSPLFPSDVSTSNWTPAAMAVLNMIFGECGA